MMSNFKIVHEIDGRLRVRFGQYAFYKWTSNYF